MLKKLAIESEIQKQVFEYWESCRGTRAMPARADIDPVDIPKLLPHIGLIDVLDGGQRFYYRLVGTNMNRVFGTDFTGTYLFERKSGSYAYFLQDLYRRAVSGPSAVFSETDFGYEDRRHLWIERLVLPLSDDGRQVNMLLFSNVFRVKSLFGSESNLKPFLESAIREIAEVRQTEVSLLSQ